MRWRLAAAQQHVQVSQPWRQDAQVSQVLGAAGDISTAAPQLDVQFSARMLGREGPPSPR